MNKLFNKLVVLALLGVNVDGLHITNRNAATLTQDYDFDIQDGDAGEFEIEKTVIKNENLSKQVKTPQTCDSTFKRLISENKMSFPIKGKFEDRSFPPDQSSLFWTGFKKTDAEAEGTYKKVHTWARISDIDPNPSLWGSKGIRPAAIVQGQLGDCWFLSSMAAVAENSDRIAKIFNNRKEYAKDGKFEVNLWSNGERFRVTFDDQIPVDPQNEGKPINLNRSPNGAWWGPILEKGAAKFFGRFENMDGGFAGEALYALTGYPTREWMRGTYTKDEVWKIVSEGDKRNYIMTTGVPKKAGWDSKGLPQGHAYSLLGAKEYNGEKLFQIRNPWGSELYNGNWSDKDTAKWTPEAKAALGHEIRDDGVFWVPLDDWMELFDKVTMNYYQDWKVQKKKVDFDRSKSEFALKFNNPKKQRAILGATGYHSRMFRDESCHPEERITDFQVQILDQNENEVANIDVSDYSFGQGWSVQQELPAGTYNVYLVQKAGGKGKMPVNVQTFGEDAEITIV